MTALEIRDLSISYATDRGPAHVLRHVTLQAQAGEVLGIVGESGCGKSTLALAILALLPHNARVEGGAVLLHGDEDLLRQSAAMQRSLRGRRIAMVFQDAMQAFNPVLTLGRQLADFQDQALPAAERRRRALSMLARVGLPDPATILTRYVHELSGGMRQRVGIAAALLNQPSVLVADEPTTALDVTMEAQILHLLRELRAEHQGAIVIITHHLGVVGELCDRVAVMYAGEVVEEAPVDALYHDARHPYTRALIACDPAHLAQNAGALPTIPGRLPDLTQSIAGCAFAPRCPQAVALCHSNPPPRVPIGPGHHAVCHRVTP